MAKERLSMRKTREILREKWEVGLSHRKVMQSLGVSLGMVSNTVARAQAAGLHTWAEVEALSDEELEEKLYGPVRTAAGERPRPDPVWIHTERQKPGVTLELLHMEYLEQYPDDYGYTTFCEGYRQWLAKQKLTMRQVHRGGEKLFVDYSGKKPSIVDPKTGEVYEVELFVAVLGASSYTYAEATRTQKSEDWIGSHARALADLGGVPAVLVPDQPSP
jgi:transposase